MKGVFVASVLSAVVLSVFASSIQLPNSGEVEGDVVSYNQDATQIVPEVHGNRMKRSPLDPIVAPLIIGKSFLYGALLGPKLFRPRYYYHPKPQYHHYGHGYGWGWGWK
ncbi:uncharacterized protein LOC110846401 [Folsomia candida]|uniref:Uncharacterized protein n=1 Tax=Folsomia candida TaxID=158441 RepID=A0A226EMU9_FOLCA|nr:uncharacterized protein LOC110846401 [Folsomia candida]OXA58457.1 hypothetical protein Fcan01_07469 [Folsomia candida]